MIKNTKGIRVLLLYFWNTTYTNITVTLFSTFNSLTVFDNLIHAKTRSGLMQFSQLLCFTTVVSAVVCASSC